MSLLRWIRNIVAICSRFLGWPRLWLKNLIRNCNNEKIPLSFKKAGRVLCGGARETHWATCHNRVTPTKTTEFSNLPAFSDLNGSKIRRKNWKSEPLTKINTKFRRKINLKLMISPWRRWYKFNVFRIFPLWIGGEIVLGQFPRDVFFSPESHWII